MGSNGHGPSLEGDQAAPTHEPEHGEGFAHHEMPHEPAPPEPRHILPDRQMLIRGLALLALAIGALVAAVSSVQKAGWLAAMTLAPLLTLAGALAGWAAAIHLTNGEKFDDHPWV